MKLQVLGPGCSKCKQLKERAERAVDEMGIDCQVEYITDMNEILAFGIMMTPGLAIDGEVQVSGKVPSVDKIKLLLDAKVAS